MDGLITSKYHIISFFKSDEVAEDMCLLKRMYIRNHLENQTRNHQN